MRVLISGGGIAGLTLAILLKQQGIEPTVVEREPGLGATGYMMDFFGTGWDVAERMGLTGALRVVRYPIERMEFVASDGKPYCTAPIERMRAALDHKYVYLRWSDLEKILFDRACTAGVKVHFGASIESLNDDGTCVRARFADQTAAEFDLVVGADGVHSNVRALAFGPEQQFARYLGYYAAAFHFERKGYGLGHAFKLYEETDRTVWLHPLDAERGDATLVFRHTDAGHVAREERAALLRAQFASAGWVTQKLLRELDEAQHIYLDSLTQIVMPEWHRGRVVLVGDACGCLTLAAGQGSQIAMAGAWILARELARHADHRTAFAAYQDFLKPHVATKQRDAVRFAGWLVPSAGSWRFVRRLAIRLMFSAPLLRPAMKFFGTASILQNG